MKKFSLNSEVTLYPGMSGWHFGHIDRATSQKIKDLYHATKGKGFGSIKVTLQVNDTVWGTSIFPDKKTQTYMFPIKSGIRKKEHIYAGDHISFILEIM